MTAFQFLFPLFFLSIVLLFVQKERLREAAMKIKVLKEEVEFWKKRAEEAIR